MANYTAADVKRLRELTGSGMLDCKNALANNDGDFDKAVEEPVSYTHLTLPTILRV